MVALETPKAQTGWQAPAFSLPGVDGKTYTLNDVKGENGTVVMYICNHCPFVKAIKQKLIRDANALMELGVGIVAINANDADNYPDDSFEKMKLENYPFPYLFDETQEVAKTYDAVCTPDFFGFDSDLKLAYRGRLDDSGMQEKPDGERELFNAMKSVAEHGIAPAAQNPSIGCNIKWRE